MGKISSSAVVAIGYYGEVGYSRTPNLHYSCFLWDKTYFSFRLLVTFTIVLSTSGPILILINEISRLTGLLPCKPRLLRRRQKKLTQGAGYFLHDKMIAPVQIPCPYY
jgi:hypothetical protein